MDIVAHRSAGLDVHRSIIVACALLTEVNGRVTKERGQFPATAAGLGKLAAWLKGLGVSHVGMESTGVYWMPDKLDTHVERIAYFWIDQRRLDQR